MSVYWFYRITLGMMKALKQTAQPQAEEDAPAAVKKASWCPVRWVASCCFLLRAGANSTGFLNPTRSQLREVATHVAPHVAHASFLEYQQEVCSFKLLVLGNRGIHRPFLAFRYCPNHVG